MFKHRRDLWAVLGLAALLLALRASPAAADPVSVDWTWTQPRRYLVQAAMNLPEVLNIGYSNVGYSYIGLIDLKMLVTCSPPRPERKRVQVRCAIDALSIRSRPFEHRTPEMERLMANIDHELRRAVVELQFSPEGRLEVMDADGLHENDRAAARNAETLRQILRVAFGGFDATLPVDWESDPWSSRQSALVIYPDTSAPISAQRIEHRVMESDPVHALVRTTGEVTLRISDSAIFRGDLRSELVWDETLHSLRSQTWEVGGKPTVDTEGPFSMMPWLVSGQVKLLEDGEVPRLPPSGLLD